MISYKMVDSYDDKDKGKIYVLEVVNQMYKQKIEVEEKSLYRYLIIDNQMILRRNRNAML